MSILARPRVTNRLGALLAAMAFTGLLIGSFVGLREKYAGDCLFIPWWSGAMSSWERDQFIYQTSLGVTFGLSFIALGATLARLAKATASPRWTLLGAAAAASLYVIVAVTVWYSDPVPRYGDEDLMRLYFSGFWPIGILQREGHYLSLIHI